MRSTIRGSAIDAYIVSTWDEHLNEEVSNRDKRTQFISGFTGKIAHVIITKHSVALWTDEKYLAQANSELNCDWKIFALNSEPSIPDYLMVDILHKIDYNLSIYFDSFINCYGNWSKLLMIIFLSLQNHEMCSMS